MNFSDEFISKVGEVVHEGDEEAYEKPFTAHALLKQVDDDDELIVEGYANTKFEDRHNEFIVPRAYKSSLKAFKKNGVILYGHSTSGGSWAPPTYPIGVPKEVKIDDDGLLLRAKIEDETPDERIVASKIRRGLLKHFSVGFITRAAKWIEVVSDGKKRNLRMITDLELLEVSIVGIPANRQSVFSVAKALNSLHGNDFVEYEIDTYELTLGGEVASKLTGVSKRLERKLVAWRLDEINKTLRAGS